MPEFAGLKVTADEIAARKFGLQLVRVEKQTAVVRTGMAGTVASGSASGGGNSGFQAMNLAVQFGATRILLVGFDMRDDRGVHWHGRHPSPMNNPGESNFATWRAAFAASAPVLARRGVAVVNCSPVSTIAAFPVMRFEEAVAC